MNTKKMADDIRKSHKRNKQSETGKRITLCFDLMETLCRLNKSFRLKKDVTDCCYAALIVSGLTHEGLAEKTVKFLEKYEQILPARARTLLRTNLMQIKDL
jgi:hypothetical protein